MSQLLDLRDAVVAQLAAVLPPAFTVDGHLGRFTPADLSTFLTKAPAAKVAILGLNGGEAAGAEGEALDCRITMAIYVVTKDGPGTLKRDAAALGAVETIVRLANGQRWGLDFTFDAHAASAQNLTAGEALNKVRAFWGIEIVQPVRLGALDDDGAGVLLRELFVGVAPEIGLAHEADYIGPFPEPSSEAVDV